VTNDRARQEHVWESLARSCNKEPYYIRRQLCTLALPGRKGRRPSSAAHCVSADLPRPSSAGAIALQRAALCIWMAHQCCQPSSSSGI
jgi:hypothetical protein